MNKPPPFPPPFELKTGEPTPDAVHEQTSRKVDAGMPELGQVVKRRLRNTTQKNVPFFLCVFSGKRFHTISENLPHNNVTQNRLWLADQLETIAKSLRSNGNQIVLPDGNTKIVAPH